MKTSAILALILAPLCAYAASPPIVSNVRCSQVAGTKNVQILYNVSDADNDLLTIGVQVSGNGGLSYNIPATSLSGHVGTGVVQGNDRTILWSAGVDWNGQYVPNAKVRVTAGDSTFPAPPPGMALIPAGTFQMGDNLDGITDALPVHNVQVSSFYMDRFEVTKELWQQVQAWGAAHSYSVAAGSFYAAGHPVQTISWYDAVKWCNARSEMEGLTPCYYTDVAQTLIYRTGSVDVSNTMVKWTANGYRLPTEAEWEKASRGGIIGQRYPWGDTVNGSHANYYQSGDPFGGSNPQTSPVGYYNGAQMPTGIDMANGYGLYDMAGNVFEWCYDWYESTYYGDSTANSNPHGPTTGTSRLMRGGSYGDYTTGLRCANRGNYSPINAYVINGFRCARGL